MGCKREWGCEDVVIGAIENGYKSGLSIYKAEVQSVQGNQSINQ